MYTAIFRWIAPALLALALVSRAPAQATWPPVAPGEKPYLAVLSQLPDQDPFSVTFDSAFLKPRLEGRARTSPRGGGAAPGPVTLPAGEQDGGWSPRLAVEGLLDPGLGSVGASFRYVASSGDGLLPEIRNG